MALRTTVFREAEQRGWSDAELARQMGMSQSTISRVKHGRVKPTIEFREGIKRAFPDYDVDRLLWWEETPSEVPA